MFRLGLGLGLVLGLGFRLRVRGSFRVSFSVGVRI